CVLILGGTTPPTYACGGLFCQNIPVDQAAERIIFTVDPGQVSAYVQVNYTGAAPDFAWVVPVPTVPEVDVAEMTSFSELQSATDPVFMLPPQPDCLFNDGLLEGFLDQPAMMDSAAPLSDVTVFASGEAGPYEYDVVGTETGNANALIDWLNENNYRITSEMEPLVFVYVREEMVFLAMKLKPEEGVQDIQPIKMTYASENPMIPIRLTAVAATDNMGIYTWIFGRGRAESLNYAGFEIDDNDLSLTSPRSRSTNYLQLVASEIDRFGGQAFVTEYAKPSQELSVVDPLLQELRRTYPYVTRFYGQMSPNEMTIDPVFGFNSQLPEVSNIHDLRDRDDLYPCQDGAVNISLPFSIASNSGGETNNLAIPYFLFGLICAGCLIGLGAIAGGGFAFFFRRRKS
ncbi:MAG: DUF2330 domain-containing protein, partial [Chloroflexota bacterium]